MADAALHALRAEAGTSALVVITGNVPTDRFLRLATMARRTSRVVLVRVWPPGDRLPGALPGAKVIDVDRLDQFQAAWAASRHDCAAPFVLREGTRRPSGVFAHADGAAT